MAYLNWNRSIHIQNGSIGRPMLGFVSSAAPQRIDRIIGRAITSVEKRKDLLRYRARRLHKSSRCLRMHDGTTVSGIESHHTESLETYVGPTPGETYDLIIVGAGPVGLLAAHGASRRGCKRILILEKAREFTKAGQSIDVQPNGIRVLKMLAPDVYETLNAAHPNSGTMRIPIYSYDGTFKFSVSRSSDVDRTISLQWWQLQRALLDDLSDNIEIRNDAYVSSLNHFSDHVRIKYTKNRPRYNEHPIGDYSQDPPEEEPLQAGEGEEHEVCGRVCIAADGIRSQCRNEIYRAIGGDDWVPFAHPIYTGMLLVKVSVDEMPEGTEAVCEELAAEFRTPVGIVEGSDSSERLPRLLMVRRPENKYMFYFFPYMSESLASQPKKLLGSLSNMLDSDSVSKPLQSIIAQLAKLYDPTKVRVEASRLKVAPLISFEELDLEKSSPAGLEPRPFAYKRAFLAGDSLHGCPPQMGLGTSMGFEDVCELVDLLSDKFKWDMDIGEEEKKFVSDDELSEAAERYRKSRMARLKVMVGASTFPKPRSENEYLEERKYITDFKPAATGWKKYSNTNLDA